MNPGTSDAPPAVPTPDTSGEQKRKATYEDLEAAPPHLVAELVGGELYLSPLPTIPHAVTAAELATALTGPFGKGRGGPGGWRLLFEPELRLGEDVLVPDLTGWRRERVPGVERTAAPPLAPDWVCEVLSDSTRTLDRTVKLPVYAREGVRHVWLVDPETRELEVLRLENDHYQRLATHSGQSRIRAEPFEALEFELALLWEA